jgi:ubiquinone biosynthesis protein Coq4
MSVLIDDAAVEPVVRILLGATDVDGGTTDEQRAVLTALIGGAWNRTDLDLDALQPLGPSDAAGALTDDAARRRARELLVLMEMCRHPLSEAQVARVDEYVAALGMDDEGTDLARDLVKDGAAHAIADFVRYIEDPKNTVFEPTLDEKYTRKLDAPDPELGARLKALHDLPAGTLGYEYVEFYRRNGITLPGDDPSTPAMFVSHDMCHVIGGYEPTGQGEIALGAMQLAITDSEPHWIGFLGNLSVHEAGYFTNEAITGKPAALSRGGAPELIAHAMWRGSQCDDFTGIDHLALVEMPLEEVRARYKVPPLDPNDIQRGM